MEKGPITLVECRQPHGSLETLEQTERRHALVESFLSVLRMRSMDARALRLRTLAGLLRVCAELHLHSREGQ